MRRTKQLFSAIEELDTRESGTGLLPGERWQEYLELFTPNGMPAAAPEKI